MADRIDALWSYVPFFAPFTFLYEPMKECLGAACYFFLCFVIHLCICSVLVVFFGKPGGASSAISLL